MKTLTQRAALAVATLALLAGCAGQAVQLGSPVNGKVPTGESRVISAEACGFQLLLFIPIGVNGRLEAAYSALEAKAGGDFITDVEVQERWTYGFVGTSYCTELRAKAIHARKCVSHRRLLSGTGDAMNNARIVRLLRTWLISPLA